MQFFYPVRNFHFLMLSENLVIWFERSQKTLFETSWKVLVYLRVLKIAVF